MAPRAPYNTRSSARRAKMSTPPGPPAPPAGSLAAFFARRAEAASSQVPMPMGAEQVHDAVNNHPELAVSLPRTAVPNTKKQQKTTPGPVCMLCSQSKQESEGYFTCRNKNIYCKACSATEARTKRLMANTKAMCLWKDLPPEEKQSFRLEKSALEGAALKDALSVKLLQRHLEEQCESVGNTAEYLPISVYTSRGYNDLWLKWIQETHPCREEGPEKTYALRIAFEKSSKEVREIIESIWRPLDDAPVQAKKKQKSSASSGISDTSPSETSSSSSSDQKKGKKNKKSALKAKKKYDAKAKKLAAQVNKERKIASRMLDSIAPTLKMLEVAIEQQLTPAVEGQMPPYQVKDAKQWYDTLKADDQAWTKVLKGEATIKESKLDVETTRTVLVNAKTSQQTFSNSMALAVSSLSKSKGSEGCSGAALETRKKTKKKLKH